MGNYPTSDLYYEKSVERRKAKFARAIRKIRGENRTGLQLQGNWVHSNTDSASTTHLKWITSAVKAIVQELTYVRTLHRDFSYF